MRNRIRWVAMTSVVLAVTVLGVPLVLAIGLLVTNAERQELEQLALRAAVDVSSTYQHGDPIELPRTEPGVHLAVYDVQGRRVAGAGPAQLAAASSPAVSGAVVHADEDERLVEAVPVARGERVIAVVRADSAESAVNVRILEWSLALLGGCAFAAVCAGGFASWQSRRLVRPLAALARSAGELGAGDFSVRTQPSGVSEIDTAGDALNRTAERLASLIERERSFSAYASHQLRTPLTQLRLELEYGLAHGDFALRTAAGSAVDAADRLSQTIDDVLQLARGNEPSEAVEVAVLLNAVRDAWHGPLAALNRPLRIDVEAPVSVACSVSAVRQILHVLLDNAFRHGRGVVTVRGRDSHGAVAIDVIDEGVAPPIKLSDDSRLGLSLAASLARSERGRLLVDQSGAGTRFTVLLPAAPPG